MNRIYNQEDQYLNLANSFHGMYQTPSVLEDATQWMSFLKSVVIYLVLAPHDNHQVMNPQFFQVTIFRGWERSRMSFLRETRGRGTDARARNEKPWAPDLSIR